jgi:amino acid transporter
LIAWATMAVGFATALGAAVPSLAGEFSKNVIATVIIIFLTVLNIAGVNATKILSNIITVSKLVPLVVFIVVGIFYVNGSNFVPVFPKGEYQSGSFAAAAILLFFAYTGYEAIAVGAEDMEDPKKNLPRAIIVTMILVSVLYMFVLGISIGILGPGQVVLPHWRRLALFHVLPSICLLVCPSLFFAKNGLIRNVLTRSLLATPFRCWLSWSVSGCWHRHPASSLSGVLAVSSSSCLSTLFIWIKRKKA